jgi:hypothetical protein
MALADDFYQDQRKANRRIAEALISQGTSSAPTSSHLVGANRVLQGLLGGLGMYRADQADKAREDRISALLAGMPGLGGETEGIPASAAGPIYGSDFSTRAPDGTDRSISAGQRSPSFSPVTTAPVMPPAEPSPYKIAGMPPPTNSQDTFRTPLDAMSPREQGLAALRAAMGGGQPPQPPQPPMTGATPPGAIPVPTQAITPPAPAAPPPMALGPTAAPPAAAAGLGIDPAQAKYIRALMTSGESRLQEYGMKLYQAAQQRAGESYRPLTDPAERTKFGIPADDKRPYQVGPGGKLINPPAETRVNVDTRAEGAFATKAGGVMAERFGKLVEAGDQAPGMIADLESLREIGSRIGTGKIGEVKAALGPYAEALGIKIDQLGDLQAFNAITAKMAPRMRPAGSGATSDYEMRQYLEALPTLGKTAEGNKIIADTNQAMLEYSRARGDIAARALSGELTQRDADKMIRALPDPMDLWRQSRGASPAAAGGGTTRSGIKWSVE